MPSPVAHFSDYGVALRKLHAASVTLGWVLAVCLLIQMVGFAMLRYSKQPYEEMRAKSVAQTAPATDYDRLAAYVSELARQISAPAGTQPAVLAQTTATRPAIQGFFPNPQHYGINIRQQWHSTYYIVLPMTQVIGLVCVTSMMILLLLMMLVILVAQAPGVAPMTSGLIWSVLLVFMTLPWQYFANDFPVPGVLYGYGELLNTLRPIVTGESVPGFQHVLVFGRFIIWPIIALVMLLGISEKFREGLQLAIGHPLDPVIQPKAPTAGK